MELEAYILKGCISENKYRIKNNHFNIIEGTINEFIIDNAGYNALTIISYYKYEEIFNSNNSTEKQLHELISSDARSAHYLKEEALDNQLDIYNQKVSVDIGKDSYSFEIKGVGPIAIKISKEFTYDEIIKANDVICKELKDICYKKYSNNLNDINLTSNLQNEWKEDYKQKQELRSKTLEEEEIRRQKQKELEEFLNS